MIGRFVSFKCVFILVVAVAMSGCVSMMAPSGHMSDSLSYVRQHKGEGARSSLLGNEAELMDSAAKFFDEGGFTVIREPHAVLGKATAVELSYAFYFYPSATNGQTEVEVVIASPWFKDPDIQKFQRDALSGFFPISYINTRLLDKSYDPNVKDGAMLALTTAAFYDDRGSAIKLINRGASVDSATNELKDMATRNLPYLSTPANKKTYDRANAGVELLNKLKEQVKQSETEKGNDARFQEALRARQTAPVNPELPEAARRFKVQAEDAVREKKFDDAADLYKQALDISPLWPEGHFNRALVLGETGSYDSAVREMKRYLLLVPNASNARAAQDKIYIWERKADAGK